MKIKAIIWRQGKGQPFSAKAKDGGIICEEEMCPFRKTCANHTTAGDFRYEDGFSPQLSIIGDDIHCLTRDVDINDDLDCHLMTYPVGIDSLEHGFLNLNNGNIVPDESDR